MIWKKEVKRTHNHCIFFDLGSDWDFSNIDSVFNTGERSEPEFFFDFDISNMPISEFWVTIGDRLFFSQCH